MFETLESHLKARRIRAQLRAAGLPATGASPRGKLASLDEEAEGDGAAEGNGAAEGAGIGAGALAFIKSPFDALASGPVPSLQQQRAAKHATSAPRAAGSAAAASLATAETGGVGMSFGAMGSGGGRMSTRLTASGMEVCNSAPIPTLLPPGGEGRSAGLGRQRASVPGQLLPRS